MIRDLQCTTDSLVGPVDARVVDKLRSRYPITDSFVTQMTACHGAIPEIAAFRVGQRIGRGARFLTLLDAKSEMRGDFQPHFDGTELDARVAIGIPYLMEYEHQTSRTLFDGLVPFGALLDDICLDRGYVDLICLDCRIDAPAPSVVLWNGNDALTAYMEWESLGFDQQFDDDDNLLNVAWDAFLTPLADNFDQFINELEPIAR